VTGRGERDDAERDARERKTGSFVRYVVAKMRGEVSSRYEFRERELRIAHLERGLAEPPVASAPTPPRPPLPNPSQLNSFTHATLQNAVKGFNRDQTDGDVQAESGGKLSPQDARRVRLMFRARLLRLNDARKLVVDERVGRRGSKYALRYLDESGSRWLDPIDELSGPKG
jgi:hypothetical protein